MPGKIVTKHEFASHFRKKLGASYAQALDYFKWFGPTRSLAVTHLFSRAVASSKVSETLALMAALWQAHLSGRLPPPAAATEALFDHLDRAVLNPHSEAA